MDIYGENWSTIIALSSVGFGWFLSQITQLLRFRGNNRRTKKRVLYDLLEINFILSRLDNTDLVDEYLKYIKSKFPKDDSFEQLKPFIQVQIENLIYQREIDIVLDELDEIEETYNQAIIELSKIRPIRAYYLRGVSKILDQLEQLQEFAQDFTAEITVEAPEVNTIMSDFINSLKQEQFNESIENIKKEIKRMSFSIGIIMWIQSNKVIKKKSILLDDKIKETLDSIFDKVKQQIQH